MNPIEARIRELTEDFIQSVITLISESPFAEVAETLAGLEGHIEAAASMKTGIRARQPRAQVQAKAKAKAPAKRRSEGSRRSSEEVELLREQVVNLVREAPEGMSMGDLARRLGLSPADLTRPVALAVASGAVVRQGERRLSRYFPAQAA